MRTPGSSGQHGSSSGQPGGLGSCSWSWCRAMVASLLPGSAGFSLASLVANAAMHAGSGPVAVCWVVALVAGAVLALVAVDGLPAGPPRPSLGEVTGRLGPERPVRIGAAVGIAVV